MFIRKARKSAISVECLLNFRSCIWHLKTTIIKPPNTQTPETSPPDSAWWNKALKTGIYLQSQRAMSLIIIFFAMFKFYITQNSNDMQMAKFLLALKKKTCGANVHEAKSVVPVIVSHFWSSFFFPMVILHQLKGIFLFHHQTESWKIVKFSCCT